jgi:hypothetical protein
MTITQQRRSADAPSSWRRMRLWALDARFRLLLALRVRRLLHG